MCMHRLNILKQWYKFPMVSLKIDKIKNVIK